MKSKGLGKIQFVNVSPGNTASAEEQRRLHSHAARTAHAKARRLCTMKHQASKANQVSEKGKGFEEGSVVPKINEQPVLPNPVGLLASDRRDPFKSFARPFSPTEHFLLDYCESFKTSPDTQIIDVGAVLSYMDKNCNKLNDPERYLDLLTTEWVRLTLTNVGSLNGMFLASCRHLLENQQQSRIYKQLAIQYKLYCVQALREAITFQMSSLISDSTVAMAILLAYDELQIGDLPTFKSHL